MKRLMSWALILSVFLGITFHIQINRTVFEEIPTNENSREELYQDIIMSFLTPYIEEAASDYYRRSLIVAPYSVKILSMERPNGYRTFAFRMVLEVVPYVGPHLSVGVDHLTITIQPGGEVLIEDYVHTEPCILYACI